ncbi:MarR family winged helix-turn-helix transcriptional regulator [Sphingomonas flavalba]|uniref:MarR family winged helix-turn-helix transcriptional regulator n=1 Tax=Sphingomonas flavalba TaxID=2559804 RepID=UPI00109E2FEB|nr:MarR family transcriptional regulator [Sphingomonas flavalba]
MSDSTAFLIGDISRLMRRRFDERARRIGVTRPQWRMLFTLSRNEGANQGTLAELIDVEPITLCRMVDRLQDAGLVERRRDPADRRAWQLYLTEQAHPILGQLRALADSLFEECMDDIADADRARLNEMLTRIRQNLVAPEIEKAIAHG